MKKYELTSNFKIDFFGRKLFQIRALISFGIVRAGDLGGWIQDEKNLDHNGNAWVSGDAWVSGNARVYGDADYTTIKGFGSVFRTTTFFKCKDGLVRISCGCFYGTIEEFRLKVKETHGNTKLAVEYLKIADLMEYHFSDEEVNNERI